MKKILFLLVVAVGFAIGCQKDEVVTQKEDVDATSEVRTGSSKYRPIFHQGSISTDNYTLPTVARTQISFKKSEIDTVYMEQYNTEIINVAGVPMSFYIVRIQFKNGKANKDEFMSKYVGSIYKFKPSGNELYTYPYQELTIVRSNVKQSYFDIVDGVIKTRWKYDIQKDTTTFKDQYLNGYPGSLYLMKHQN